MQYGFKSIDPIYESEQIHVCQLNILFTSTSIGLFFINLKSSITPREIKSLIMFAIK